MKKQWSNKWKSSSQPRKQRKYRYNAPLHTRRKFMSANLSGELRADFGKRSIPLRKGDEVIVMRGSSKDARGEIERLDIKEGKVYIDGVNVKKVDGSEVLKAIDPSNLKIVKLKLDDKRRQMVFERVPKKEIKRKAEKEKKKEEPKKETAVKAEVREEKSELEKSLSGI